jgi:hypothetical protein
MDNNLCIFEIDNFISKERCDEIIIRFESDPNKHECRIYCEDGYDLINKSRKSGVELPVDDNNVKWYDILKLIFINFEKKNVSSQIINKFCNHFKKFNENPNYIRDVWFRDGILRPEPFLQICRTTPNTEFRWHNDEGDNDSYFIGLIYLNSIKHENGGATEFLDGKKVQPEAGKLLLFPSNWSTPHRGMFVTEHKYVLSFRVYLTFS